MIKSTTLIFSLVLISMICFNKIQAQPSNDDCSSPIDLDSYLDDAACTKWDGVSATTDGNGEDIMPAGCVRPGFSTEPFTK